MKIMRNFKAFFKEIKEEKIKFQGINFFFILFSFLLGNLVGINSKLIFWNGISLFLIPIILELINSINSKNLVNTKKIVKIDGLVIVLNSIKRGFLLGIFLEAFKVGS